MGGSERILPAGTSCLQSQTLNYVETPDVRGRISDVATRLGVTPESIRQWPKRADLESGRRHGLTTEEREELR